jgi:hypothetical protein
MGLMTKQDKFDELVEKFKRDNPTLGKDFDLALKRMEWLLALAEKLAAQKFGDDQGQDPHLQVALARFLADEMRR